MCFLPDSLGDYEDAFAVETPAGRFEVQLRGRRPHPELTLPPVLEVSKPSLPAGMHAMSTTYVMSQLLNDMHMAALAAARTGPPHATAPNDCLKTRPAQMLPHTTLTAILPCHMHMPAAATGWQCAAGQPPLQDL